MFLDALLFQAAKKGFSHYVVLTVTAPTHTGLEVMLEVEVPSRLAAKLCPLIGVNQNKLGGVPLHDHQEYAQHGVLSPRGLGGPVDNPTGVQVHHDGQIQPAYPRVHGGDVGASGIVLA